MVLVVAVAIVTIDLTTYEAIHIALVVREADVSIDVEAYAPLRLVLVCMMVICRDPQMRGADLGVLGLIRLAVLKQVRTLFEEDC